jgi:hypothetical protein
MSALAILKEAADCGVRVNLNGDRLALKAATKPPADLLAKLRAHKSEIVAALREDADVTRPEPDDVELEERKSMAMDSVPEPYLDTWARLQCQKPMRVSDADWRQAIDVAGRFLDQWGSLALEFRWAPADLFDIPRDGRPGGLVWFLNGETVRSLGPEHAVTTSDRVWRRARPMAAAR